MFQKQIHAFPISNLFSIFKACFQIKMMFLNDNVSNLHEASTRGWHHVQWRHMSFLCVISRDFSPLRYLLRKESAFKRIKNEKETFWELCIVLNKSFKKKIIPHKILERVEEKKTSFFSKIFGHFRLYFLSS